MHNSESPTSENYKKSLYKTEICRTWYDNRGKCKYGDRCQYAHGSDDMRQVPRHPKYKTEACYSYYYNGVCPYGARCNFLHDEHQKLITVESSSKYMNVKLPDNPFSLYPERLRLNPNAPVFNPQKTHVEIQESVYAKPNYTDSFEMPHDMLNDSGLEHSTISDSGIEPFVGYGFTCAKTFFKQHEYNYHDACNDQDEYGLNSTGTALNSCYGNGRLPIFAKFSGNNT